ncbi:endonuclease/exonuclease/phosphatase family metal-dependent hydrolase [Haloactinopolyspora alba]|uniref:Endonuclease/exonuclease/phosphatase family metal-dependent hydrolase n=1 Tax=Haloactinopolyspora alba TaxID=648780 RepID=A0A2P8E3M6_9ACTN|nr:endonuclease/exonuclease/phosphatase family metal-dependent hydrolase [Haloactinopolyspora alba]
MRDVAIRAGMNGRLGTHRRRALTVCLTTVVLAEVMRVSFPLLYDFAGGVGFTTAAVVVPLMFAAPLAAAPLGRWVGPRAALVAGGGGLAVTRVIMQAQSTPGVAVAVVGTLVGLVALSAALRRSTESGDTAASAAFFLGLTVDTGIRVALTTWDAAWQSTPFAWIVGLALPALLAWSIVPELREPRAPATEARCGDSVALAALPGPLFALQTLVLANPAFVASSGQTSLPFAGAVVLVGLATAAVMPAARGIGRWVAGGGLVVVAAALTGPTGATGVPVWIGVVTGQACAGALVMAVCARTVSARPSTRSVRTGLGAGIGSLALVGVLLSYQISYEIPLGIPQPAFVAAGAVMIAALAWRVPELDRAPTSPDAIVVRRVAVLAPVVGLLVPLWSTLTWPEPAPSPAGERVRIATYNIHSAVSWHGRLDPEAIARVLEAGGAQIAMLQEVSRGWPLGGGLDGAAWLSRRLGAEVVYGATADHQLGNVVLSEYPIARHWSDVMDKGTGTMRRGYLGSTVVLGETTLDVWTTQLQHQDHTTATRQAQGRQVLDAWRRLGAGERSLIGGDLNARPGSPDIRPWFDGTGLVSAQDVAGDPLVNTSPSNAPDHRIDWIFGTSDIGFSDVVVPPTLASDHLPVFVTVRVAGAG